MIKKIWNLLNTEVMRYLFIGGCTTLVNLVTFAVLCDLLHVEPNVANVISIICAIAFAYVANKLVVFRSHTSGLGELAAECAKFVGGRLLTMGIEVGGFYLLYTILQQPKMLAKVATQFLVIIGNYFISKFLVFRGRK